MKLLATVFIASLSVGSLSAQYWSVGGFGSIVFPGIGHAPAGNPWGNVVSPAIPQGAAAYSSGSTLAGNRYGGLVPGFRSNGSVGNGHRRSRASEVYAYPAYIGGYGYGYAPAQPDQPAADNTGGTAPAQPPVVINQYFGAPPADPGAPPDAASSNYHFYQAPADNDAASPGDSTYYLIAFKDHTIYSAVAYYTEGDTLHYFTSGNVHNQASLALVDRQLTEQLNRDRNVTVRFPQ